MKTSMFLGAGVILFLSSCYFGRDIQVERVNMQLVKIDTLYRESGDIKVLSWTGGDRLTYQSLEPINVPSPNVGTTIAMLIKR